MFVDVMDSRMLFFVATDLMVTGSVTFFLAEIIAHSKGGNVGAAVFAYFIAYV
jgi:hypothetical protein